MADLKRRHTFKRWAPDIGENRELDGGPVIFLEIATGLTADQLKEATTALTEMKRGETADELRENIKAAFVEALTPFVRVHGGPHTVDGLPLATFDDYVALTQRSIDMGRRALNDVWQVLVEFNRFGGGNDELFLPRRFGGSASTGGPSVVKNTAPTAEP